MGTGNMNDNEELMIIKGVGVGARDVGYPVLWFSVESEGTGALQVFRLDNPIAQTLLASVNEIHELNGKPCVVEREGFNKLHFRRLAKI